MKISRSFRFEVKKFDSNPHLKFITGILTDYFPYLFFHIRTLSHQGILIVFVQNRYKLIIFN